MRRHLVRTERRRLWLWILVALSVASLGIGASAQDLDGDGVDDTVDNCINTWNPGQEDPGGDLYGLACDCDFDGSHFTNAKDFSLFLNQYRLPIGSPSYDLDYDLDSSVSLNGADFRVFLACFGTVPGPSGPLCEAQGLGCRDAFDFDLDDVANDQDNCIEVPNPGQLDTDGDQFGNLCDGDFDGDGLTSGADVTYFTCGVAEPTVFPETDLNGDGSVLPSDYVILDGLLGKPPGPSGIQTATVNPSIASVMDFDLDGLPNYADNCQTVPNSGQENPNLDRFGLACDADYDGDGNVTLSDFDAINGRVGTSLGQPGFDPDMDHDLDGMIGPDDVSFAVAYLGQPVGPSGLFCAPLPGSADLPVAFAGFVRLERGGVYRGRLSAVDPNGAPVTFALLTSPSSGTLSTFDANTGEFVFDSNPGTIVELDGFDFTASDGSFVSLPGRLSIEYWTPADDDYSGERLESSVLVLYNENAPDAQAIATYYASARGVSNDRLCGVKMSPGLYGHKDDLLEARDVIVRDCICPLIPQATRPSPCDSSNAEAVASVSPIRHLALMRGLPARLHGTDWSSDSMEPSLDYYLSHLLYNSGDPFEASGLGLVSDLYGEDLLAPFHRRAISPALDGRVAYGRIEAMTKSRTEDLIDRTLAAEAAGFSGKILGETVDLFDWARRRTGTLDPLCEDSVTSGQVVPGSCRAATTASVEPSVLDGALPGAGNSTIPMPLNTGLFLGGQHAANTQSGFNGAGTLESWRAQYSGCLARCADHVQPEAQAACMAASDDWFQELDTGCVGGAPGLVGTQLRSYTVTGYGFQPTGWGHGGSGAQGQTAALELPLGGYVGSPFADSSYIHYGVHDHTNPDASMCPRGTGPAVPCPEVIGVRLEASATPAAPLPVVGNHSFSITLRHRNQAAPGAQLNVSLVVEDSAGGSVTLGPVPLDLSAGAVSWSTLGTHLNLTSSQASDVAGLTVVLDADVDAGIRGWLDLDTIQVVDDVSGVDLLPLDVGGFAVSGGRTAHLGDWAATAIDRLGAIAWWGSASHHLTAGFAFDDQVATLRAFFAGRTLGESVAAAGRPESGMVYGDPLYRPSAAALYFPSDGSSKLVSSVLPIGAPQPLVVDPDHFTTYGYLYVNAYHGSANASTLRWQIASCPGFDEIACDAAGGWTVVMDQTGAVREKPIDWMQELVTPGVNQEVTLRLEVWNPGAPGLALYDYLHVDYQPVATLAP